MSPLVQSVDVARRILVRALISGAFVWLALRGIRVDGVFDDIAETGPLWLAGGLAVLAISFVLGAVRWRLLVRGQGIELGLGAALYYSWIGLFFTNVLPGGFGGDAVRAWVAGRRTGALSRITASVLVDRLAAAWALVAVGAGAVLLEYNRLPEVAVVACLLSCAAVIAGSALLLIPGPMQALSRATARWPRVSGPIERVGNGLASYSGQRGLLLRAVAISLAQQFCVLLAAYLLARALDLHVGLGLLATCIPVALLATAAPTTINGLGVREAVFRVLLVPAGVAADRAVAFSLMTVIAAAIVSLPGAVAWIALHYRRVRRVDIPAWLIVRPVTTPSRTVGLHGEAS